MIRSRSSLGTLVTLVGGVCSTGSGVESCCSSCAIPGWRDDPKIQRTAMRVLGIIMLF